MSINQKSGRQTFRRRFVSGSLFVSPCLPECNFQSETKIGPDLRLLLLHIYCTCFVSSKIKDKILLIYCACFVSLKSEIYFTCIPLKNWGMFHIYTTRYITHTLYLTFFSLYMYTRTSPDKIQAIKLCIAGNLNKNFRWHICTCNSGFGWHNFRQDDFHLTWPVTNQTVDPKKDEGQDILM